MRGATGGARLRSLVRAALSALPMCALAQPVSVDVGLETPATARATAAPASGNPFGRRVVELNFKPASLRPSELGLKVGEVLTPQNLSAALNQLAGHLGRHSEMIAAATGTSALIFTYVDAQFDLQPKGTTRLDQVGVTLRPFHLSLPLDEMGGRMLPVPRGLSAKAADIAQRSPLLPANVSFGHDRVLGTTGAARWQYDSRAPDTQRDRPHVHARAGGMKSVDAAFYSADGDARVVRDYSSGLLRQIFIGADGSTSLDPRAQSRYHSRSWGGNAGLSLSLAPNSRLLLGSRYARAEHKYTATSSARWTTSDEWSHRAMFEAIPPRVLGFFRAAVWQDNFARRKGDTSHRLTGRAGYAKEIPVAVNQSVGVEIVGGAGQTWDSVDAPRRFFAGGSQGEFLYEGAQGRLMTVAPDGPLVRSLGKAQGGFRLAAGPTRGGTRFAHLNLNISLPIPKWSRPLIPNEVTDLPGPDGTPQTLKQLLRTQVDRTGPNMLQSTLQASERLAPDEARRRAAAIFDEIRPAAHFVIDQANVFAVKPLLLFDTAELETSGERASWTAAGAGVQLTVVTAKFEAGYMRTLSGPTFGARGNFFARLGFERLF